MHDYKQNIFNHNESLHCFKTPDVLTTGTGVPIDTKTATMTVGPRGPVLLQDVQFLDEMSHFDRERIPERVVHAKGGGAFGYFEVTNDISKYCKAKIFERIGKRTPCVVRFSTVGGYICLLNVFVFLSRFKLSQLVSDCSCTC